jgi:tetratricopeptide (TPR) repeat protein
MRRIFLTSALILFVAAFSWADYADFYYNVQDLLSGFADPNTGLTIFPTLLIPLGGKLEGMGTAFTAIANDTGFLEANPAGSAILAYSELSFLHHNWIADSRIEGVIYTIRMNHLGIGAGGKFLYVPFTGYNEYGERSSRGVISETIATFNISYNLFSSYKFYGLALGSNVKVAYRNIPPSIHPGQSAITAMVDFGMLTRFNFLKFYYSRSKNFSLGVVLKNLGLPAKGEPLPTLFTSGIAYSPARPVTIAVDFNLPVSFNPSVQPAEDWNIATGIDVNIAEFLSIQGGFQLKENPRISLGGALDLEKVSFIANYNLDLSGRLNPLDKFSLEAKLNLGDSGRLALQTRVEELYANGLEAYANGDFKQAMAYWEEALRLNPEFLPAIENLNTLKKRIELQDDILRKQKVSG